MEYHEVSRTIAPPQFPAAKQRKNSIPWLEEYKWQKGQSGNPNGRPKTRTLKEFAREFLAGMSDEGRIRYFEQIDPELVWKMAEGNPAQGIDVKGEITNLNAELTDEQFDRLIRQRAEELDGKESFTGAV